MSDEVKEIPLRKATYEELQEVIIELKNRIHDLLIDDTEYKLENARLKKKYENAVSDYELEHYKVVKAIEYINKTTNNTMFELRSDTGELNYLMRILKGE